MPQLLKVLFVEDSPADVELAVAQLRRDGFEPISDRVDSEAGFLAKLHTGYDLILSDHNMPKFSGQRALVLLKQSGLDIPFILLSGTIGEDTAVKAIKEGASDYILKDRLGRLGQAVIHALAAHRGRQVRQEDAQELLLFRTLVNQSTDSFEVINPETGQFLDANEMAYASLGYTRSEFLALRIFDVDPTILEPGWLQLMGKMRTEGSLRGEGSHQRKDGSTFPVEFNVKWVKMDREYLVAVVRDMTERKEMEANYFRAQRLDSIGSMASGIAHDMNNVLAPILMAAPLLRLGMSPENTERTLATIENSAQRGADLVRQLLTFGRGVEGARRIIKPTASVHEMAKIAQQTFPKNISIIERTTESVWPILGDTTQIHQVLLNLCVNARDAMPQGGLLTISAENIQVDQSLASMTPGAKSGPYVLLKVTDTGTGVPSMIVDRIFDPFFTTKDAGDGTGLGLSTVIGIAKSHGGFVSLVTKEGKGSTFQVYLPAVPEGKETTAAFDAAATPFGNGELILVVDDEENIREIIRDILVSYSYQVLTANDGADATSKYVLHSKEIKAVITDLDMPVMDGMMLIHVLRNINPTVHVLVSSGLASLKGMESRKAQLEALGVKTILRKPYTVEQILQSLEEVLTNG